MTNKVLDRDVMDFFCNNVLQRLSDDSDFQNAQIQRSPRAVGDLVQEVLAEAVPECFPAGVIKDFSADFARRAMADLAFSDTDDNYYVIDVKTHNRDTAFNMPNLTSVERLARFYEDDRNFFVILLVEYQTGQGRLSFTNVHFNPIEFFCWDCLTIGALGWGQIQIANSNHILLDTSLKRREWMLSLCDQLDIFYPKEIAKIESRMERFRKIRQFWEQKHD